MSGNGALTRLDIPGFVLYTICTYEHIDTMTNSKAEILKILGDQTRLRVIQLLAVAEKSLCVCEIIDALKLPQYQVSKSFVMLHCAGLVDVERNGTWGYYHPNDEEEMKAPLFDFVKEYCTGEPFYLDADTLDRRLERREGDKCVVGFFPGGNWKSSCARRERRYDGRSNRIRAMRRFA